MDPLRSTARNNAESSVLMSIVRLREPYESNSVRLDSIGYERFKLFGRKAGRENMSHASTSELTGKATALNDIVTYT